MKNNSETDQLNNIDEILNHFDNIELLIEKSLQGKVDEGIKSLKKDLSRVNIYYKKIKTEKYGKDDVLNENTDFIYFFIF